MGILIGSFLLLMLLGLPVALAMICASLLYILATGSVPNVIVAQRMIAGVESFPLLAVPFFILAGNFLTHGGVARRMITFATVMVGHWYGGLALAGVMACALFAAVSGSSPANSSTRRLTIPDPSSSIHPFPGASPSPPSTRRPLTSCQPTSTSTLGSVNGK